MPERGAPPIQPDWPAVLEEALTMPGQMSNIYNRFYRYSFGNQILLFMQGVREPVNTYQRWAAMGRQVKRGSKAKYILRPVIVKEKDQATGEDVRKVKGFKPMNCLFGASETDGADLPEYEPPEWNETRALGALGITRVNFNLLDGNVQGYSFDRNVAVNPVASEPLPTMIHEIGHIEHGHTATDKLGEYATHRGLMEFEAEATAYLALNDLGVPEEHWRRAESRAYIQSWLHGETVRHLDQKRLARDRSDPDGWARDPGNRRFSTGCVVNIATNPVLQFTMIGAY